MRSVKVLVAVLAVAVLGATAAFAATAFDDVPQGAFYDEPTAWAVDQGLTVGCDRAAGQAVSDTFCPTGRVTRGENITFTYRHQTLVIDPLLDDIRDDVNTNRDAAAAAQTTADWAASAADAAQSAANAAQAAAEATEDKVDAVRQRAALLQWSNWQGTIDVGLRPLGVAFDGTHIWTANYNDNTVSKIDAATGDVTVAVGNKPYGVAFDGTHIWVVNHGDGTVSKIPVG